MSAPAPALPVLAGAATGIFVGSTMVATRYVIGQTDPISLALLRYAIGVLLLVPPVLLAARVRFARADLLPIAALGIGQFGVLIALLNYGLQYIGSGLGALIFTTFPLFTVGFGALWGHELPSAAKTGGVLLTILGVGLALGAKVLVPAGAGGAGVWLGVAAVFASAATGGLCSVLYRPYLRRYPPLHVGAFAMLASVLFLAVPAAAEGFFAALPTFTPGGWAAVVFIGASSSAGYVLWLWALKHSTPTRTSMFLALGPVTATALGAALLDEPVTGLFLAGLACVAGGLWLAHWTPRAVGAK
ncbi:MAG: DMT family transporter [Hyphomicrobiales bacterium]|nr:DMT family transporter [Hyphomicrobiales bacterium]